MTAPAMTAPAVTIGKDQVRLSAAKYDELLEAIAPILGKFLVAKELHSMGCPVVLNWGRIEAEDGWVIEVERYALHSYVDIRWWRKPAT